MSSEILAEMERLASHWIERDPNAAILTAAEAMPLLKIARGVATREAFEPDSGWPMGQACPLCPGFGAYTTDLSEGPQPETGGPESAWDDYRAFCAKREADAVSAIAHAPDCVWVLARKLAGGAP